MSKVPNVFPDYFLYGRAEFVFEVDEKKIKQLDEKGVNSKKYTTGDIDWHLNVATRENSKTLSTFLFCQPVDVAGAWKVETQFRIVLENQVFPKDSIAQEMKFSFESEEAENRGWDVVADRNSVLKNNSGFLVDEKLSFRVFIGVNEIVGFESPRYFNFYVPQKSFSDISVTVDGTVFHLNRTMINVHSPSLCELITSDKPCVLKDVKKNELDAFLQMVYGVPIRLHETNVESILKQSLTHKCNAVKIVCLDYLEYAEKTNEISSFTFLSIAKSLKLDDLIHDLIKKSTAEELKKRFGDHYETLSIDTIEQIVKRALTFP